MGSSEEADLAFVLGVDRQFSFERRAKPTLESTKHVIVKVIATGICGSDIHYWRHGAIGEFKVTSSIILGHESAGIVEECGKDVKSLRPGDRVALEPGVPCRTCKACRGGKYNLCVDMRFAATPPYNGTLVTHYSVPEDFCFKLPKQVSYEEGALVEPLSVAVHSIKLADVRPGSTILVLGAGPVGLLCCAVARAFGASVIVCTDIVQSRLDFALEYAATNVHRMSGPPQSDKEALVATLDNESGFDAVIDATGVESCIVCGIQALGRGATFVQVGLGRPTLNFPVGELCSKEGVYKGSFRYGAGDYELAVQLINTRKVSVKELITHRFDFERAQDAFESASKQNGMKSIIYGHGTSHTAQEKAYQPMTSTTATKSTLENGVL